MFDIKQYCLVPPPYGGVTVYVSRLIKWLQKDGFSVGGFYSSENKDEEIRKSPFFDEFNYKPYTNKINRMLNHLRKIKAVIPYSIIHFHGLELMVLPWILKTIFNKKIVITIHSAMIVDFYNTTGCFNRVFIKKLATSDTHWIAVSEQAKEEMLKLPFTFHHQIPVIPAYIPSVCSETDRIPDSMNEYIKRHKKNLSFYGRSFMKYQGRDVYGFYTIIELYSRIIKRLGDDIGLVLCLSESLETDKIKDLHQFAKEKDVDDYIYWQIGPLNSLQPLWACTDIYVRPTFTDGDSVAIREAIDAGMIVIASDVCPRPEGVITYHYNDMDELEGKCIMALKEEHRKSMISDKYYIIMKDIYLSLLNK